MNRITTGDIAFEVCENAMMMVGFTEAGEVKSVKPLEGDANNERAMQEAATALIGENGVTSVAFLPAYFIFKAYAATCGDG